MACPQCLNNTARKFVDVTFDVPEGTRNLSKAAIRKSEVRMVLVDWEKARYYCYECGWYHKEVQENDL